MEQLVSIHDCGVCPLFIYNDIGNLCMHPNFNDKEGDGRYFSETEILEDTSVPDWCPLREHSLTIKLVTNEDAKRDSA